MRLIDEQWLKAPFFGSRRMARHLRGQGYSASRKRVRRLMRKMGTSSAICPQAQDQQEAPGTRSSSLFAARHGDRPAQPSLVRDIIFIPMRPGFMCLVAVMDWHSRRVLSWRLSNTAEADFCVAALEDAISEHGTPDIFNTDQGAQFTSLAFTGVLKEHGIKISMDGKGAWMDNVFIERLWWSLKYECVYLNGFESGSSLRRGLGTWIDFYNFERPHSSLEPKTPDEASLGGLSKAA